MNGERVNKSLLLTRVKGIEKYLQHHQLIVPEKIVKEFNYNLENVQLLREEEFLHVVERMKKNSRYDHGEHEVEFLKSLFITYCTRKEGKSALWCYSNKKIIDSLMKLELLEYSREYGNLLKSYVCYLILLDTFIDQ